MPDAQRSFTQPDQPSFGRRFVDEILRLSAGQVEFVPRFLAQLREADCEQMIRLLRTEYPLT